MHEHEVTMVHFIYIEVCFENQQSSCTNIKHATNVNSAKPSDAYMRKWNSRCQAIT